MGVGKLMYEEIKSADSYHLIMRDTSAVALGGFNWESIWTEMLQKTPTVVSVLSSMMPNKTKVDKKPVICMCIAMIAKW